MVAVGSKFILILVGTLLAFSTPTFAQSTSTLTLKPEVEEAPPEARRWSGEWNFEVGGDSFAEGKDEGAAAFFFFRSKFDYKFTSWLRGRLRPRVDLYSSRLQERYDNDAYESRVRMMEGYLAVTPVSWAELRLGAISQEYLNSPLLVSSSRAFPGAQASLSWEYGNHKLEIIGQQVIPTSYSLDTEREDREKLPWFSTQTVHLVGKNLDFIEWKVLGGHYTWSQLPDKIAFESGQEGNSVIGDVAPGARFAYGFDGLFGGGEICACWVASPVQVIGEFQRVHNSKADEGLGDGQMWGVGPRIIMGDRILDVRYRRFFTEKDTTVAVYTRSMLGNNNRMGDNLEFRLDFRDMKFAVLGEWVNATPMRDNPIQKTMTSFYLGVETNYAPF